MLETLTERNYKGPISFIHGSRTAEARAFYQHIKDLAVKLPILILSSSITTRTVERTLVPTTTLRVDWSWESLTEAPIFI